MARRNTKNNDQKKPTYRRLTRSDLVAFDREATDLILAAMEVGCLGRISSKGHCLLRNGAGGTASVTRNMTSPNRTAQNARSEVRKLIAEHQSDNSTVVSEAGHTAARRITVSQAFAEGGAAFSRWYDEQIHQGKDLPANALIEVSHDNGELSFAVLDIPEPRNSPGPVLTEPNTAPDEDQVPMEPDDGPQEYQTKTFLKSELYTCETCHDVVTAPAGIGSHRCTHQSTTDDLDREKVPDMDTEPATSINIEDPAAVLDRVRTALGEDPRVAALQQKVIELTTLLAKAEQRVEEAETRLALIKDAFHA